MIKQIIKYIFIVLTILFYKVFFLDKFKKEEKYFFPVSFISFVSVITYLCGLANVLKISGYLIMALGFVLFIIVLRKKGVSTIKNLIDIDSFIFIVFITWLFIRTRNVGIAHWDDLSHWYRICKMMSSEGRFPINPDMLYPSYLPGTACWIYFVTRFIGFDVPSVMFAQGLINISCCCCLFSLISDSKKKLLRYVLVIISSIVLLSLDYSFYTLIVDSLVGLIPLCAYLLIRNNNKNNYYLVFLILCFCSLIKASGLLFVVVVALRWIINNKKDYFKSTLLVAVPFMLQRGYLIRSKIYYPNMSNSNQAVSLSRYTQIFASKDINLIKEIIVKFIKELFNIFYGVPQITVLWLCILMVFVIFVLNKTRKNRNEFIFIILTVISYSLGLLFIYLFSMDYGEANANNLACFDRYIGTLTIFVLGLTLNCINNNFIDNSKRCLIFILPLFIVSIIKLDFSFLYTNKVELYTDKMWKDLNGIDSEKFEYDTTNYFVIFDKDDYPNDLPEKAASAVQAYFRTQYVSAISLQDLRDGKINDSIIEQAASANELITFDDYSNDLDIIRKYINVVDYKPGICELGK